MKQLEKTDEYEAWFEALTDRQVKTRIQVRVDRLQHGNPGDVAPVSEGVSELRLHFGSGWRVYYTERNSSLVILLAGGSKSSQAKDIKLALQLAQNL
jgi:putative addiction module killer protein